MPVEVFPHASFDGLLETLAEVWRVPPGRPAPRPVVIPSLSFGDRLQLRIADMHGVCMGLAFLMPRDFVAMASGAEPRSREWAPERLAWRIFSRSSEFAKKLGGASLTARDRFTLASQIADQFDQYAHFRPEIPVAWASGGTALPNECDPQLVAAEEWQRALWRDLQMEIGVPPAAAASYQAMSPPDALKCLAMRFDGLVAIGVGCLDPLLVQTLARLSSCGCRIRVDVILPAMGFLGGLRRQRALPSAEADPEHLEYPAAHPLVESMGRRSIGAFLLLGELDEQYTNWPLTDGDAEASTGGSLLHVLQSDIRSLRPPTLLPMDGEDRSLSVHACYGARREMEALRDELLRAFVEIPGLRPEDVHIVTPDMATYAPLVPAILAEGEGALPVRLCEVPVAGGESLFDALLALMEIARQGEFRASELLDLLQLDAAGRALDIHGDEAAIEVLSQWIRDSGFSRGLGAGEPAVGSLRFAIDRMIAARWFDAEETGRYPEGARILPAAAPGDPTDNLHEHFLNWLALLCQLLEDWRGEATPAGWAGRLRHAAVSLFRADDEALLSLAPPLAFLTGLECAVPVDAGVLRDWLAGMASESARRTRVSGKISFGRFNQLQNIPCRVLAIVGLSEAQFPAGTHAVSWNLLRARPRAWDRNPRVEDRQAFLDALLEPTDRLILTAPVRNLRSNKVEPFSSCVGELLRVCTAMGRPAEQVVVHHRLAPFSGAYFRDEDALPRSFDSRAAATCAKLEAGISANPSPFFIGAAPIAGSAALPEVVTARQLASFWKSPAAAFLKSAGISTMEEEPDDSLLDRPPICLDSLASWSLREAILDEFLSQQMACDLCGLKERFRAGRGLPPGGLGDVAWNEAERRMLAIAEVLRPILGGKRTFEYLVPDLPALVGDALLTKDGQSLIAFRTGKFANVKHFLESWILMLLAAATGVPFPTLLLDEESAVVDNPLPPAEQSDAAGTLLALLDGFLEGRRRPLCYAPVASDEWAKVFASGGSESEALDAARASWEVNTLWAQGEGLSAEALLAWRGRCPFEDAQDWKHWGEEVAIPLRSWACLK